MYPNIEVTQFLKDRIYQTMIILQIKKKAELRKNVQDGLKYLQNPYSNKGLISIIYMDPGNNTHKENNFS